jgi:hypothetical protein
VALFFALMILNAVFSSPSLMSSPDIQKRLQDLQLKMNKARQLNNQAVIAEKKKVGYKEHTPSDETKSTIFPPHLTVTAEMAERKRKHKNDGSSETFGWDVFNEDSLLRAHEKRVGEMGFYPDAYDKQKEVLGEDQFYSSSAVTSHKPSEDAKERLVETLKKAQEKRSKFSRRRTYNDEEDVQWINERNRHFTKKIDRAFGEQTSEIKANLERGTAI